VRYKWYRLAFHGLPSRSIHLLSSMRAVFRILSLSLYQIPGFNIPQKSTAVYIHGSKMYTIHRMFTPHAGQHCTWLNTSGGTTCTRCGTLTSGPEPPTITPPDARLKLHVICGGTMMDEICRFAISVSGMC
jgi:hypothetical protein